MILCDEKPAIVMRLFFQAALTIVMGLSSSQSNIKKTSLVTPEVSDFSFLTKIVTKHRSHFISRIRISVLISIGTLLYAIRSQK